MWRLAKLPRTLRWHATSATLPPPPSTSPTTDTAYAHFRPIQSMEDYMDIATVTLNESANIDASVDTASDAEPPPRATKDPDL
ncbi:Aste57867_18487 [Aphanomyces stellatus]|uniref:Aste57867_18487 protein n=1 Tax=Aphanomyces stellatus TaxID=120398 RepID=A0A485LB33_9STRA|nr:hypothetical protein As57867_018425 [Aphanomyces stellatus]VFT95223.1 Aste57867_18487 [Aphanomyces stellatus]